MHKTQLMPTVYPTPRGMDTTFNLERVHISQTALAVNLVFLNATRPIRVA